MFTNLLKRWTFLYFNTCSLLFHVIITKIKENSLTKKTMEAKEKITMLNLTYFSNFLLFIKRFYF